MTPTARSLQLSRASATAPKSSSDGIRLQKFGQTSSEPTS